MVNAGGEEKRRVKVRVLRWVANDPQPGVIEVSLIDAYGRDWRFVDKTAIFSRELITAKDQFPFDIWLDVIEIGRSREAKGAELVAVRTVPSSGLHTVDRVSDFTVSADEVVHA